MGFRRVFVGIIAGLSGANWFEVIFMIGLREHYVLGYVMNIVPSLMIFAFVNRMKINKLFIGNLSLSIILFAAWWATGVNHQIVLPFSGLFGQGAALPLTSATLLPYVWNSVTKLTLTVLPSLLLIKEELKFPR